MDLPGVCSVYFSALFKVMGTSWPHPVAFAWNVECILKARARGNLACTLCLELESSSAGDQSVSRLELDMLRQGALSLPVVKLPDTLVGWAADGTHI